jgi:hypothetical protein
VITKRDDADAHLTLNSDGSAAGVQLLRCATLWTKRPNRPDIDQVRFAF